MIIEVTCIFCVKKLGCEYSLESPKQGSYNVYTQHMIVWKNDN